MSTPNFQLPPNMRREHFSVAYISAIAAAAGYAVENVKVDMGNVDLRLTQCVDRSVAGQQFAADCELISVQVKCSSNTRLKKTGCTFDLEIDDYRTLIKPRRIPHILIVVSVPPNYNDWLLQDVKALTLLSCGYWTSLRGLPNVSNESRKAVSLREIFSVESLTQMMSEVADEKNIYGDVSGVIRYDD